jgi:class 3 adenylate cyclase
LLRGDWREAEAEARRASEELPGFIPAAVSQAFYQIGEIRLRRGDLPAAEEALLTAHATGRAEPALSLLRLAQGRTEAALESITRSLDGTDSPPSWGSTPDSDLTRTLLLPALVEIAIAAGDRERARAAVDELRALAERFDAPAVRARAATAAGQLAMLEGDHRSAVSRLQSAVRVWQELDAPWEAGRARRLLGEALAADGARESAAMELRLARATLERLGAVPELRLVDAALASIGAATGDGPGSSPERVLRTFVFTDIVDSTRLAGSVGDEAWDRALRWHDRTIRTLTAEHGGEEIKRTGDGFFLAFDDPDRAIDCAIGIQRRLAEPPADLGVPVAVRIGVHRAEANRSGLDYLGTGVNVAARITREAGGAEVLVSHATLDATRRRYAASEEREVTLRGVSEPVLVATVPWRTRVGIVESVPAAIGTDSVEPMT